MLLSRHCFMACVINVVVTDSGCVHSVLDCCQQELPSGGTLASSQTGFKRENNKILNTKHRRMTTFMPLSVILSTNATIQTISAIVILDDCSEWWFFDVKADATILYLWQNVVLTDIYHQHSHHALWQNAVKSAFHVEMCIYLLGISSCGNWYVN